MFSCVCGSFWQCQIVPPHLPLSEQHGPLLKYVGPMGNDGLHSACVVPSFKKKFLPHLRSSLHFTDLCDLLSFLTVSLLVDKHKLLIMYIYVDIIRHVTKIVKEIIPNSDQYFFSQIRHVIFLRTFFALCCHIKRKNNNGQR